MLMRLSALFLFLFISQNSQAAQIGKVFDGADLFYPPVEAVKPSTSTSTADPTASRSAAVYYRHFMHKVLWS